MRTDVGHLYFNICILENKILFMQPETKGDEDNFNPDLQACGLAIINIEDPQWRKWTKEFMEKLQSNPAQAFAMAEAIEESHRFEITNGWLLMLQGAGALPRLSGLTPDSKKPLINSTHLERKAALLAQGNQELLEAQKQDPDHVMEVIHDSLKRCLVFLICGYLRTGKVCYLEDARREAAQCAGSYSQALGFLAVHLCQKFKEYKG
jgi:hypothetical protein